MEEVKVTAGPDRLAVLLWLHVSQSALSVILVPHHKLHQSSKPGLLQQLQSELAAGKCDSLHENGQTSGLPM